MTRIIAGVAKGRRLSVPPAGTRPTSDRVRESMFSTIDSLFAARGLAWASARVIDGYAGSGALGLEALSRGAASVLFIEKRAPAAALIRRNIALVGLPGARVIATSVRSLARRPVEGPPASLILLDPPYEVSSATICEEVRALADSGWLEPGALVVVERPRSETSSPLPWPTDQQRAYGDTVLWYGRCAVEAGEEHVDA